MIRLLAQPRSLLIYFDQTGESFFGRTSLCSPYIPQRTRWLKVQGRCLVPPGQYLHRSRWMESWTGLSVVAIGMAAQGCELQLTEYAGQNWRGTFVVTGMPGMEGAERLDLRTIRTAEINMIPSLHGFARVVFDDPLPSVHR